MNVMSVDPGSKQIGVFVMQDGKSFSYSIKPKGLVHVQVSIHNLAVIHKAGFALIEDYAYGDSMAGKRTSSEIVGVIKYTWELLGVRWLAVNIATWQSYMSRNLPQKWTKKRSKKGKEYKARTADSEQGYVEAVNREYRAAFKTADAADAWMIYAAVEMMSRGILKSDAARKIKAVIDRHKVFEKDPDLQYNPIGSERSDQ